MATPHQQRMVADFVQHNELYKYISEPEQNAVNLSLPYISTILGIEVDELAEMIRAEIKRQRYLRGLCDWCGDKTSQVPNICIQCDMARFNTTADIPRRNWFSVN